MSTIVRKCNGKSLRVSTWKANGVWVTDTIDWFGRLVSSVTTTHGSCEKAHEYAVRKAKELNVDELLVHM